MAARKGNPFRLHKYAGKSALCYELGMDILMGNLVWIQGPYPAGAWPDIKIFTSCLAHFFKPGKCIEADDGYHGHADEVKSPRTTSTLLRTSRCRVTSGHVTRLLMGG